MAVKKVSRLSWLNSWWHRWAVVGIVCAGFFLAVVLISLVMWQVDVQSAVYGSFWLMVLFGLKYASLAFFSVVGQSKPRFAAVAFLLVALGAFIHDMAVFWTTFSPHVDGQISTEFLASSLESIPWMAFGFLAIYFIMMLLGNQKKS